MANEVAEPVLRLVMLHDPELERVLDAAIAKHMEKEKMEDLLLQFFAYEHLPDHQKVVSKPFGELARHLIATLPNNAARSVALRKLHEAKDCAVRVLGA